MYPEDLLHHSPLPEFNHSLNLCFLWGVWRPYSSSSDHLHHPLDLLLCPIQMHLYTHPNPHPPTHIHTYIHVCMYVNVSDNYPFVPNAVLKSMCMLYLSPSLCYIDSLYNFTTEILTPVSDTHNKNNNDKRVIGVAQLISSDKKQRALSIERWHSFISQCNTLAAALHIQYYHIKF